MQKKEESICTNQYVQTSIKLIKNSKQSVTASDMLFPSACLLFQIKLTSITIFEKHVDVETLLVFTIAYYHSN